MMSPSWQFDLAWELGAFNRPDYVLLLAMYRRGFVSYRTVRKLLEADDTC